MLFYFFATAFFIFSLFLTFLEIPITGTAEKVTTAESFSYFNSRPRNRHLGSWTSQQSSVISSRQLLLMQFEEIKRNFLDGEIPVPDFWGGYRIVPDSFEFWQGCSNRVNDRFLYTHHGSDQADKLWQIQKLRGLLENKIPIQIFQKQWGGGAAPLLLVLYLVLY